MLALNNEKNIVAIVEAGMTSSRLPRKVLSSADGIPMLKHLITRLEAVARPAIYFARNDS